MTDLLPTCTAVQRPPQLFDPASSVHGLRASRPTVVANQRFVDVWLYQNPPAGLDDPALWSVLAPPGVTEVEVSAAAIAGDHVRLTIAGLPDPTRYRLEVNPPPGVDFDPLRVRLPIRMRPECPDLGNCFDLLTTSRIVAPSPVDDYTARDWLGLRQSLLDFHVRSHPDADTSLADPAVTALELFAHIGDVLHYRLDRVATEAYLATARQRTSVRRHARLLDYHVGESVAARTSVHISVTPTFGSIAIQQGDIVRPAENPELTFTLEQTRTAHDSLGEVAIYDWGEDGCCLHRGATSAVLVRPQPADPLGPTWLAPGDKIAFEVIDPGPLPNHDAWRGRMAPWPMVDGVAAFRAPLPSRKSQVVELTSVDTIVDPLDPALNLSLVQWAQPDALQRSYSASVDSQRGSPEVAIARANMVDAHHGVLVDGSAAETLEEWVPDWAHNVALERQQTSSRLGWLLTGAARGLARDENGQPYDLQVTVTLPSSSTVAADVVDTHLGVAAGRLAVTVEDEPWRPPLLRFSIGTQGTEPPPGSTIAARYEAGGGAHANIPANTLVKVERNHALAGQPPSWRPVGNVTGRNVVRAAGGTDPEPLTLARRAAPQAFAAFGRRAVVPADHADAARDLAGIDRATAVRTWTGAWPLIRTVVDLTGTDEDADLAAAIAHLDGLRMLGQEVTVVRGAGVGLAIGLDVCVKAGFDLEFVRRQILALLRPGSNEAPGFFHGQNLRLGGRIHTSNVIAVAAGVHGVDAVEITMARRLAEPVTTIHEVLTFEQDEIPVLDDDSARPDRGRLELTMRGGQ